jgi:hypothetical protein
MKSATLYLWAENDRELILGVLLCVLESLHGHCFFFQFCYLGFWGFLGVLSCTIFRFFNLTRGSSCQM